MIVEAWLDSANTPIGYPMVNVRDIESGKIRATRELFGADWLFRSRGQPSAGETQLQDTRHNRKTRKQRTGFVRCRRRDMQTLGRLRSANQVYVSTVFHAELKPGTAEPTGPHSSSIRANAGGANVPACRTAMRYRCDREPPHLLRLPRWAANL